MRAISSMPYRLDAAALLVAALVYLPSAAASAQEATAPTSPTQAPWESTSEAYCDFVAAIADADRALLVAPELVARGGLVQTGFAETADDSVAFEPSLRVTAGLRYSFNELYRAGLVSDVAQAECRRYLAEAQLRVLLTHGAQVGQASALAARMEVLDQLLPEARQIVATLRDELERRQATESEYRSMQVRLEGLQTLARRTRAEFEALPPELTALPSTPVDDLVAGLADADLAREAAEADLREARAWDLSVVGGYNQTFGIDPGVPLFATLQFTYDIGRLWQGEAHDRALDARERWHEAQYDGLDARLRQRIRELSAVWRAETMRLDELDVLLDDLQTRLAELDALDSNYAENFRQILWFAASEMRAERAYLQAHRQAIGEFLRHLGEAPRADLPADDAPIRPAATTSTIGLQPVEPQRLLVTLGQVEPVEKSGGFVVSSPKMRAYFGQTSGDRAEIAFTYRGPTDADSKLASGKVRRQIGLKLRAKNGCNLLYVMWRIDPAEGIVVSTKENPGAKVHEECGAEGYTNIRPATFAEAPEVAPGSRHTLAAELDGAELTVRADGEVVWQGPVADEPLGFDGPAGIRSDNGVFEVEAFGAR